MNHLAQQPESSLPLSALDGLWHAVLDALRPQMTKATFNNWLAGSYIVEASSTPFFWVVGVRNEFAWEWLTYRLYPVIERAVATVRADVLVCFIPKAMRSNCYLPHHNEDSSYSATSLGFLWSQGKCPYG